MAQRGTSPRTLPAVCSAGSEQFGSSCSSLTDSDRDSSTAAQAALAKRIFGHWKDAAPSTPSNQSLVKNGGDWRRVHNTYEERESYSGVRSYNRDSEATLSVATERKTSLWQASHAENDDEAPLPILREVPIDPLDSNEEECSPRIVVFRKRSKDSTCSKAAKIAVGPTSLSATSAFFPILSTDVSSVDLQTSFCIVEKPAVHDEISLHSESRAISLQDTEVASTDDDEESHPRSSKIDVQFLIRLNRFNSSNVLKAPQQWRLGEVGNRITKFQAEARGHLLRMKPWIRELKEPVSSSPSIGPALRAPEPTDYSARYMTVDRLRTECALVGRTGVDPTKIDTHPAIVFIVNVQACALRYIIRKKVDAFWIHHVAASRIQAACYLFDTTKICSRRGFKTRNFLVPAIIFRLLRRRTQRRPLECAPEADNDHNDRVLQLERRMDQEIKSREAMECCFEEVVDEVSIPETLFTQLNFVRVLTRQIGSHFEFEQGLATQGSPTRRSDNPMSYCRELILEARCPNY
ncbi:hypothetical protein BC936DRAFT_144872 [Jimgerdemannia flammicorona]|uniref:Uncharacterized protein n=1 Tax=Jimgerdemannia flammicorona TaxID=994334 RepID=A0A433DBG3_9FUNG|nr:hypothetical protein BC936DRAFT_144872 [Jimgerdemannia flammicorona]